VISQFAFLGIGTTELIIILVIILLLFGAKRLPELSKSIGKSVGELRKGVEDGSKTNDEKSNDKKKS